MATQDYETCPDCGKPLDEDQADFNRRADLINEALEDADDATIEVLLTMFAARYLSCFTASERKKARRGFIRCLDEETKECVIRGCDA